MEHLKRMVKAMDMMNKKREIEQIINIFETGSAEGNYSNVTVMEGDSGGLTYGKSQTTLNSGNLYVLIKKYINFYHCKEIEDTELNTKIKALEYFFLPRIKGKDQELNECECLKTILRWVGKNDPNMIDVQDSFFSDGYFKPALSICADLKLVYPLSLAVVYDSKIHGSFSTVRKRFPEVPPNKGGDEKRWTIAYVKARHSWLKTRQPPLKLTTYRMVAFEKLIEDNNWELKTPFKIRGITIV